MQEKEQDLTEYSKHIFTLKNGVQIEVLTQRFYEDVAEQNEAQTHRIIKGFMLTPLIVKKDIKIRKSEIVAREEIREPCIAHIVPWEQSKELLEIDMADNKHHSECNCFECNLPELNG